MESELTSHDIPGFQWARACHISSAAEAMVPRWSLASKFPDCQQEPTGIDDVDKHSTIGPGRVTILAGREGTGKSAFALNIAQHVSQRGPVLYLLTEMSIEDVVNRVVASAGNHNVAELTRRPSNELVEAATETLSTLASENDLTIVDVVGEPQNKVFAGIEEWLRSNPTARMVVLDNLFGLVLSTARGDMGVVANQLGTVVTRLSALARTYGVSIVLVHHTNRASIVKANDRGISDTSDLAGSDHLGRFTDQVYILRRRAQSKNDFPNGLLPNDPTHDLDMPKNRHGESGISVPLRFIGTQMRFVGVSPNQSPVRTLPSPLVDQLYREALRNLPAW